jgi:hypothetical protein
MYYKKILPAQVLELQATEFICSLPVMLGNLSSRKFEIEFYDKDGHPLLSRKGEISGLPINTKLMESFNPNTFDYSSLEAQKMFDEQDKIIFDELKRMFELKYYDETFEKNVKRNFSYIKIVSPGGEPNVWKLLEV